VPKGPLIGRSAYFPSRSNSNSLHPRFIPRRSYCRCRDVDPGAGCRRGGYRTRCLAATRSDVRRAVHLILVEIVGKSKRNRDVTMRQKPRRCPSAVVYATVLSARSRRAWDPCRLTRRFSQRWGEASCQRRCQLSIC